MMTTDMVYVASFIMICVLGYCVTKLCLALINAGKRIVQVTEMGTGEEMVVQIVVHTTRGLRGNSIEIPPIYIPRNAYVERRVTKSFQKSNLLAVLFRTVFDFKSANISKW